MITETVRDFGWRPFEIPRSAPRVELVRLHANPATGSFLVLVRFPAGAERRDSRSAAGALALAWFSGPAEWVSDASRSG